MKLKTKIWLQFLFIEKLGFVYQRTGSWIEETEKVSWGGHCFWVVWGTSDLSKQVPKTKYVAPRS